MSAPSDAALYRLAERLGQALAARGLLFAAAESCTGGWVAKAMTDVAGSSGWLDRGFVTYTNEAKRELLGVREETLAAHGAVSEATVREMAAGTLAHSGAALAVAISGIAGPGGGSAEKPVGTVWLAWAQRDGSLHTRCERFDGDREAVRRQATARALAGALALLERGDPDG